MKYLCLIHIEADKLDSAPAGECLEYAKSLRTQGKCHAAEALAASRGFTILRLHEGKPSVTDGPFAETREVLAGFYVIEAADLEEAIELASKIPPLNFGRVELRPILGAVE